MSHDLLVLSIAGFLKGWCVALRPTELPISANCELTRRLDTNVSLESCDVGSNLVRRKLDESREHPVMREVTLEMCPNTMLRRAQ